MADDSVVDDDESKIVTQFILDTCRMHQPNMHRVSAAMMYVGAALLEADNESHMIPLITGSTAEFYIQPMLSCVGDIDMMFHGCDHLAIPDGYPPPSQLPAEFNSRVMVFDIIDSEYPGYVYLISSYLLTLKTDADKYEARRLTGVIKLFMVT